MSKRKGQGKKRRSKAKPPKTPKARLRALADALNRCEAQGATAIFTQAGAILPPVKKGQKWEAHMFAGTRDAPKTQPDDLDD